MVSIKYQSYLGALLFVFFSVVFALPVTAQDNIDLYLQFDPSMPFEIQKRLEKHLSAFTKTEVLPASASCPKLPLCHSKNAKVIVFGETGLSHLVFNGPLLSDSKETYALKLASFPFGKVIASRGSRSQDIKTQIRSNLFGAYQILEHLGYRFSHPFEPLIPKQITFPDVLNEVQSPRWRERGFVHHTMHPLEMTHVLNGWGLKGPQDKAGWQAQLIYWEMYLEWLVAQRQNKIEWVLLEDKSHPQFSRSPERQARIKVLVKMAHKWRIKVGIDAPLALAQQNAWRLLTRRGTAAQEKAEIFKNLDWLAQTKIDFFSTEMGFSEFTKPTDHEMLNWLNWVGDYLDQRYKMPFYTKVHISSAQWAAHYKDPQTGKPLNFNYLPYYAHKTVGVMPHTVQIYSLDDPAHTYGQTSFKDMLRYLKLEMGRRRVLWFPESAYWVNYDIHLPLFLPVYAQRRWHDLSLIQKAEQEKGHKIEGQIVFSSGFEWGYWFNDWVSAQGSWADSKGGAFPDLSQVLKRYFKPFGRSQNGLTELLTQVMAGQHHWLVWGGQIHFEDTLKLNGMAYLSGQETWSEMGRLLRQTGVLKGFQTQADKVYYQDVRQSQISADFVQKKVLPLLDGMAHDFSKWVSGCQALSPKTNLNYRGVVNEICDGLEINLLRTQQVKALYQVVLNRRYGQMKSAVRWLNISAQIMDKARVIVTRREAQYRSSLAILNQQGQNPTAYGYGYLAPAHHLYYWQRDHLQVATPNYHPCLMNIMDPFEIALSQPNQDLWVGAIRFLAGLVPELKPCVHLKKKLFTDTD